MVSLIQQNLSHIRHLCKAHGIAKLWVFGSAVYESEFGQGSDIDFLFNFDDGGRYLNDFPYVDAYLDMQLDLKRLLGRKIDLTEYGDFTNPYFKASVEETKELLYDKESAKISV